MESALECTCHHAIQRVVRSLGLHYALYAFSDRVVRLLKFILAAVGKQRLFGSGKYIDADGESDSVDTTSTSWWSSGLSSEEGLGAGG